MNVRNLIRVGLLSALVGCTTIERAHRAQREVETDARASAAEAAVLRLDSIAELVAFALTNRPSVVSAELEVKDAHLALREIAADAPLVSSTPWNAMDISASMGHSESSPGTRLKDHAFRTDGRATGTLSLELLVYDFGRNAAASRAQVDRVLAAETALDEARFAVFKEVTDAAFGCREKAALLVVAETNLAVSAVHLEQVERQVEAGEAKPLDVTRAKLDLAESRDSLVSASNEVVTARAELVHALGSSTVETRLVGALCPVPLENLALTNAPAYRVAAARVRAASADVDKAIAALYPTLSASTSLSWTDPLWYFRWGVSGAQSIFSGGRTVTAIDRAVVALQSAASARDAALLKLTRDFDLALAARNTAAESIRTASETLATAEENFALVDEQVRLGEANRVDWTDAQRSVTEARGAKIRAEAAGQRAEAALFALLGLRPEFELQNREEK